MKRTTAVVDTAVAPLLPCGPPLFCHTAVEGEAGSPPLGGEREREREREWRGASGGGGCAGKEELVGGGAASSIATAGDLHRHAKVPVGQVVQVLDELELELSGSHCRDAVCP
jgi:hypothetical protein